MPKTKIRLIGDPILEKIAKEVKDVSDAFVKELVEVMLEVVKDDKTAGLAAPQVGQSFRVIVVKRPLVKKAAKGKKGNKQEDVETTVMINPEIVSQSTATTIYWEGCKSVVTNGEELFGPVERRRRVTVKYLDEKGKRKEIKADGFFSHVIQHEIDHLDGILFVKYVEPDNLWKASKLDKYIEKYGNVPEVVLSA